MKMIPMHDNVIIRLYDEGEKKFGSIIAVDSQERPYCRGRVMAVGPGTMTPDGIRVPMQAEEDSDVVFHRGVGLQFAGFMLVKDKDIVATYTDDAL